MSTKSNSPWRGNTSWMGKVQNLTVDQEQEIVDRISAGRDYIDRGETAEQRALGSDALRASNELVRSYSPLIEKIASETYYNGSDSDMTLDDYISEAYIVALQCARKFDPSKGHRRIRFSGYMSRAVVTALHRVGARSHTLLYVPGSRMTDARKWSHAKFDLENQGIPATDEAVSEISGVKSTESEVFEVLQSSTMSSMDEEFTHPSVEDEYGGSADAELFSLSVKSICDRIGFDEARQTLLLIGIVLISADESGIEYHYDERVAPRGNAELIRTINGDHRLAGLGDSIIEKLH